MITPELLEQVENYLLWRCLDKKWFEHREQLGKPVNIKKLLLYQSVVGYRNEQWVVQHIKDVQDKLVEARMSDEPLPITDAERAKMLETHRNYFANYLFDLMRQKNFTEDEVAAKAHIDAAIFDRLRNDRICRHFFSDYLFKLIKQKNLSDVEVYKAAHLDRRIFSKIRNEKNYMPAKKTVVAIAFALKLDIHEINNLLACAVYFLSNGRKEDVIAAYFIDNRIYDLFLLNEVLDYYGCPLIGD